MTATVGCGGAGGYGYRPDVGRRLAGSAVPGAQVAADYGGAGAPLAAGDTLGVCWDPARGEVFFTRNGTALREFSGAYRSQAPRPRARTCNCNAYVATRRATLELDALHRTQLSLHLPSLALALAYLQRLPFAVFTPRPATEPAATAVTVVAASMAARDSTRR
jgi:hypothetical protein